MGTRVNSSSVNASSTAATAYTVQLGVAVQAGDLLILAGASQGTHAANGMSASMTATSEAFTTIREQQGGNASSRWLQTFFYVATQAFLSTDTVTFTPYAASTQNSFCVDIFRGYTGTIDQAAQGASNPSGTNTAPALPAAAAAGALVLTMIQTATGTLTAGSPFTTGSAQSATQACAIGFVLSGDGSSTYGSTWTLGTAGSNATETVSFLALAAGPNAQRYAQQRDYGQAWWLQRDRRDANTTGSAANPLVPPLDSAWQADAQYSHLYGDSHLRDRRAYFYQRPLVSDPALLAGVPADPLALNPEQSPSSDLWRAAAVPAFCDRREVPQQRAYVSDPSLLATALLENELLGGADTARRYTAAAANAARWWMPQQPPRLADPLLIGTAELENELLGGAQTWLHYVTSAYIDRREVPQQRLYVSDPSAYPPQSNLDPLLAGQDYLELHQHQAATHYDRREVPQQRLYISDPSFYPTQAPTDPLTVAWGAGGPYWHLYNRAADITDRREVPQQRAYVSDPSLLGTALLEGALLGGADDLARHRAWYADRRVVPQQRAYFSVTGAPFDVTTDAWADLRRRWTTAATHYDRRLFPQQRLYFPLPAPPLPFTVGVLTAATASGTLTAADTAMLTAVYGSVYGSVYGPAYGPQEATLTATDTRAGGPG